MRPLHSLKLVCQRTGLSPQLVRTWEKRYAAVTPVRTDTHRRLYSEEEITRLDLLHQLTGKGHAISRIASLSEAELRRLLESAASLPFSAAGGHPKGDSDFFEGMFAAIESLDTSILLDRLQQAVLQNGHSWVLENIARLTGQIGDRWRSGSLRIAHEHLATAALRIFLGGFIQDAKPGPSAPLLLVCTPAGQHHDLGAFLAGAAACNVGWRVSFLGASLPSEEIAAAAIKTQAKAVALSIVYPADDPNLPRELEKLGNLLPLGVPVLIGGRSASSYHASLEKIKALPVTSLSSLQQVLEDLCR
ncbi:MAG: MerR family transcriptional regulator [Verrucomicrobiaceae bacterium]|nr:MAG: MerR family transcriptional regulator [Verrucomicrobiaceae bacterium]